MAAPLIFLSPISYQASTNPVGFVYHIDFPGDNLLSPVFKVYKVNSANNVVTQIGLFATLSLAQSACQSDYAGPSSLLQRLPLPTVYA
jgi:hypothetical protein